MKISSSDLAALTVAVSSQDTLARRDAYRAGNFPRAERCKDRNMRYRWDLLALSGFALGGLYEYLNDDHIDTALRHIVAPL